MEKTKARIKEKTMVSNGALDNMRLGELMHIEKIIEKLSKDSSGIFIRIYRDKEGKLLISYTTYQKGGSLDHKNDVIYFPSEKADRMVGSKR